MIRTQQCGFVPSFENVKTSLFVNNLTRTLGLNAKFTEAINMQSGIHWMIPNKT